MAVTSAKPLTAVDVVARHDVFDPFSTLNVPLCAVAPDASVTLSTQFPGSMSAVQENVVPVTPSMDCAIAPLVELAIWSV